MATTDVKADVDYYHIEPYGKHQYLSRLGKLSQFDAANVVGPSDLGGA